MLDFGRRHAISEWKDGNRTLQAENEQDEKVFRAKGYLMSWHKTWDEVKEEAKEESEDEVQKGNDLEVCPDDDQDAAPPELQEK